MNRFDDFSVPVSVIVRSNNSERVIGQTLEALFSQSFQDFELIISDYNSEDHTREIEQQFPAKRYCVPAKRYCTGQVLNQLVEKCRGEIVVFLNADALLASRHSLWNLLETFWDPDVAAAFGRQMAIPGTKAWVQKEYQEAFPEAGSPPDWLPFSLAFGAIRRSTWEECPFPVTANGTEDFEWGRWIQEENQIIEYVPNATVYHSHNYKPSELRSGKFVEGDADPFIQPVPMPFVQRILRYGKYCLSEIAQATKFFVRSLPFWKKPIEEPVDPFVESTLPDYPGVQNRMGASKRGNTPEPPRYIKDFHTN